MTEHDLKTVRAFLAKELETRQQGGAASYVREARKAYDAFERVSSRLQEMERAKQVADFDKVWPGEGE